MQFNPLRLRNKLAKSRSASRDTEQLWPRNLPAELLLLIAAEIKNRDDVIALSRTSRILHAVAAEILYKSIDIEIGASRHFKQAIFLTDGRLAMLRRTLQVPQLIDIVTEFRVSMAWCGCKKPGVKNMWPGSKCTCDNSDMLLGRIISLLENLQVLHFACWACHNSSDTRHQYLETLRTTRLREMGFQCRCMPSGSKRPYRIFTAPYSRSVTALRWNPFSYDDSIDLWQSEILRGEDCLPQLERLMCKGSLLDASFSRRNITHLACDDVDARTHSIIASKPGSLAHLHIEKKMHSLPEIIVHEPTPYLNLRHIGTFDFITNGLQAGRELEFLKTLTCLPNLISIDILKLVDIDPLRDSSDQKWVCDIAKLHVALQRIYVETLWIRGNGFKRSSYWMWETRNSPQRYAVREYSAWDLLCEERSIAPGHGASGNEFLAAQPREI